MFFSFISVVLTVQNSAFFNISKKKQLALNAPTESVRPLGWKEPSGADNPVSSAIPRNAKTCKEVVQHPSDNSTAFPRKNSFLSAFDNPEIVARFQNSGSQNVPVQASNPTSHGSPVKKETVANGLPSPQKNRILAKRRLPSHDGKPKPRPSPPQGKRVAGRVNASTYNRTLTRTMIRRVQKTVTKSVVVPFYHPVMPILHHPVTSIVTRSILVPVIQHSVVTVNAMPLQRYPRILPYPRVSQAPPFYPVVGAPDVHPPATVTVTQMAQPNPTPRPPEEHREQLVKTVTRYVGPAPENNKSPDLIHPARTVTVFRSRGDQTVTLDLRERKTQDYAVEPGSGRSRTEYVQHVPTASSTSSAIGITNQAAKSQGAPRMEDTSLISTNHSSIVPQKSDGQSNLGHIEPSIILGKSYVDDDTGSGGYVASPPSRSAVVLIRPISEKSTVTITNISTITVTKSRESSSIAYSTVTISDTSQLNDRLQELENSFKSGAENYLNLITRIIRMLENERRTKPAEDSYRWPLECNQTMSKYLEELETRRALAQPSTERKEPATSAQHTTSYSSRYVLTPRALSSASSRTLSSIPRALGLSSTVVSGSAMSKSSKAATPKALMHKVFKNPLLEILDLVSGNDGRSNLVDATVRKNHSSITSDISYTIPATPSTLTKDAEQQLEHASRTNHSASMLPEANGGSSSPKNELLEELMRFINKDSRSEQDILKILGLIRLVKNDVPGIYTGVSSANGVPVAKTVTIVSEDSTDSAADASTDSGVPSGRIQETSSALAQETITVYFTKTLSEVRTETMSRTLTVDHTVTHQETQAPRTVTVSRDVPHRETVTVKQTVTQYRTVAYRPPVYRDAIVSPRIPLATTSTSSMSKSQKELYILAPEYAKDTTSLAEAGHAIELGNGRGIDGGALKVIEVGGAQGKSGPRSRKRKKRIRSAEITLENLSGTSPRIIDVNLPVDQLRKLLEKIGKD